MNPALSRLVAHKMQRRDLSMPDRATIAAVVERSSTVAELPGWLRSLLAV